MPESSYISNSNKKLHKRKSFKISFIKNIFAIIIFLILFYYAVVYIGDKYYFASTQNKINEWSKQRFDDFYNTDRNTLDMIFLGSSHSYCTFDPENFDSALNIKSFQLGMPSQQPNSSYYTLKEVLNYQRPKTVVMELYWDVLDKDFEAKQVDTFFLVLNNDELKKDYIKNVFPIHEKVKYYIKPIKYQQDFIAYTNKQLIDFIDKSYDLRRTIVQFVGEEYYRSKGYIYCDYIMSDEERSRIEKSNGVNANKWKLSSVQKNYITKIAELCKDNNVELIFVTAPVSNITFSKMKNYENIHNKISEVTEELNVDYLDFNLINEAERIFNDDMFRDSGHLNDSGVKVADEYFIRWLGSRK